MGQIRTSRPSPAIIVAVLALVAALAGTALAGSDVATSALSKKKVKRISKKQINKLAPGLSVANAANADALGGKPASAFASPTSYRTVQSVEDIPTFPSGTVTSVNANCQPGEHAIGGGGSSSHARIFIYQSVPTSSTEWSAAFSNQSGTAETNVQIRAFVICASP